MDAFAVVVFVVAEEGVGSPPGVHLDLALEGGLEISSDSEEAGIVNPHRDSVAEASGLDNGSEEEEEEDCAHGSGVERMMVEGFLPSVED